VARVLQESLEGASAGSEKESGLALTRPIGSGSPEIRTVRPPRGGATGNPSGISGKGIAVRVFDMVLVATEAGPVLHGWPARRARFRSAGEPVDLRRQNEIVARQARGGVGRELECCPAPAQLDVRVVALRFGD
jgi:hypothetical protein